jgi:hypothetical protein
MPEARSVMQHPEGLGSVLARAVVLVSIGKQAESNESEPAVPARWELNGVLVFVEARDQNEVRAVVDELWAAVLRGGQGQSSGPKDPVSPEVRNPDPEMEILGGIDIW